MVPVNSANRPSETERRLHFLYQLLRILKTPRALEEPVISIVQLMIVGEIRRFCANCVRDGPREQTRGGQNANPPIVIVQRPNILEEVLMNVLLGILAKP